MLVRLQPNESRVCDLELVPLSLAAEELEILDRKHELDKARLLQQYPSFSQIGDAEGLSVTLAPVPPMSSQANPSRPSLRGGETYPIPASVWVTDLLN